MNTALSNEGMVVMSQEQYTHEKNKGSNNQNKGRYNRQGQDSEDGCKICFERYGPKWKVNHTTKQHDSKHYEKKKNTGGFESMNFNKSNR
jgi:hypothetical protein